MLRTNNRKRRIEPPRLALPHVHWFNHQVPEPYEMTPLYECRCGERREGI